MSDDSKQEAPIPFRPYPEVAEKIAEYNITNFNYWANVIFAEKLGVRADVIDGFEKKYRRYKPGEKK